MNKIDIEPHYHDAVDIMQQYPWVARKFTWLEVVKIWELYSEQSSAQWLSPTKETVGYVFGEFAENLS